MNTVILVMFAAALVLAGGAFLWTLNQPEPRRAPVRRLGPPEAAERR